MRATREAVEGRNSAENPKGSLLSGSRSPVGADDFVFVEGAFAELGDEDLPHPGAGTLAHGVAPAVPGVEIADHRDAARVGRPYREMHPGYAFMIEDMGAHLVVEPQMGAFRGIVVVERPQHRSEGIGIDNRPAAGMVGGLVAQGPAGLDLYGAFEQSGRVQADEFAKRSAIEARRRSSFGAGDERPRDPSAPGLVHAQNRKRILVAALDDRGDVGGADFSRAHDAAVTLLLLHGCNFRQENKSFATRPVDFCAHSQSTVLRRT